MEAVQQTTNKQQTLMSSDKQFPNITFVPIRWKEVVDWLDYIYKQEQTDNYKVGIYNELYNNYITVGKIQDANVKQHLISILLTNFYDEMLFKFPPPVDLLFFDCFLLFGYKYGYKCIERSFSLLQQYTGKFPHVVTDYMKDMRFTSSDFDLKKYGNELAYIIWNLDNRTLILFSHMLVNEMYSTGSFLLKRGLRTLRDFTEIIGFRVASLLKFLVEKFDGGISVYCLKGKQLIDQNFIVNEEVIDFITREARQDQNFFS